MSATWGSTIYAEMPIMPLNAVLFPGMPMPLLIFEDRYLRMVRECVEEEKPFGVSLIREGAEVGGPAVPWEIGTAATIVRALELPEGGLHILTLGVERYRLDYLRQEEPVLIGDVELLPDPEDDLAPAELHEELRELFGAHLRLLLELLGRPEVELNMPETATRLSYMVAAHLTCPPVARQRLLEMESVAQRLFAEKHLLHKESEEYRLLLAARRKYDETGGRVDPEVFSLN